MVGIHHPDHFDGIREWKQTRWGIPLSEYRNKANARLNQIASRPYLVCQNGDRYGTEAFVRKRLKSMQNFIFIDVRTNESFGEFPHPLANSAQTDMRALLPSD